MKTEELSEFPRGKELYCPKCYFDDDKEILRVDCKHYKNPALLTRLDVVEHDICRDLHFIRQKQAKTN